MMDAQISRDQWRELKEELFQQWEELTEEDIERTHGSIQSIYGLVSQKCDLHEDDVKRKLTHLLDKYRPLPHVEVTSYHQ